MRTSSRPLCSGEIPANPWTQPGVVDVNPRATVITRASTEIPRPTLPSQPVRAWLMTAKLAPTIVSRAAAPRVRPGVSSRAIPTATPNSRPWTAPSAAGGQRVRNHRVALVREDAIRSEGMGRAKLHDSSDPSHRATTASNAASGTIADS